MESGVMLAAAANKPVMNEREGPRELLLVVN